MIGLSRCAGTQETRSWGARVRSALPATAVVSTFTWPANKPRVRLEGDVPASHLTDGTKRYELELRVNVGGNWVRWCHVAFTGTATSDQPWMACPAPPAGASCEMRVIPVAGTIETGAAVRAL